MYNLGWGNNPIFSYKINNTLFAPSHAPMTSPSFQKHKGAPNVHAAPKRSNQELMMKNFVMSQTQQNKKFMNQSIHTNELIKQLANKVDSLATHNKLIQTRVSQASQEQEATVAPAGIFPGQLRPNPKGHANAITQQSGTEINDLVDKRVRNQTIGKSVQKGLERVPNKGTEREPRVVDNKQTSKENEVVEK